MQDISGFGLRVIIRADSTFPSGITVTEFADDADPLGVEAQQIADAAMSLNGDLVTWTTANPIPMNISVIPESDSDISLSILAEANRVSRSKSAARDVINATIIYPDGRTVTLNNGKLLNAPMTTSVAAVGRMNSKTYTFAFEGRSQS